MKSIREIQFKTTESKTKLTVGSVCYQGQLIHNTSFSQKDTLEMFAEHCHQSSAMTSFFLDSLKAFIQQELARGNRLNFGSFAAGIGLRGGFPSANAPFDPSRNALTVELIPCEAIRKTTAALKPVNVTSNCDAIIYNTLQVDPERKDYDVFSADGDRTLSACGIGMDVHPGEVGEGAWIENDAGEKMLVGEDIESDYTLCRFTLKGSIRQGSYWVVVCSRHARTGKFVRSRRRITAV